MKIYLIIISIANKSGATAGILLQILNSLSDFVIPLAFFKYAPKILVK